MNNKLADYTSVAKRIHDATPEILKIETSEPVMLSDKMGYIRATVYLKNDRLASATATFVLGLPGAGARATNPIEDCETSAVGRALAFLGYLADKKIGYSVASREEVEEAIRREIATEHLQDTVNDVRNRNAQVQQAQPAQPAQPKEPLRERMIGRIVSLVKQAEERGVNMKHHLIPLFYEDIDALSDDDLATIGKYITKEIESYE